MQNFTGQTIGPYRIVAPLGSGGMATVYRAVQYPLGRDVALKVLTDEQAQLDPLFPERFRREASSVALLVHPNIVKVIDYGTSQNMTYMVMEYVPKGTLRDMLDKDLPLPYIASVLSQVADALNFAHEQGIVHRDVKPANILFQDLGSQFDPRPGRERPPWVMLADFGIARVLSERSLTQAGTGIGTPEYMSPEQAMGLKVDGRSDIYALGIVLFELVTGRLPFTSKSAVQVAMAQVNTPLPAPRGINPELPPDVEQVILKATAKNPDERYQTAAEFGRALKAAVNQPTSKKTAAVKQNERTGCRKLGIGLLAAGAALGGLAGYGILNSLGHWRGHH